MSIHGEFYIKANPFFLNEDGGIFIIRDSSFEKEIEEFNLKKKVKISGAKNRNFFMKHMNTKKEKAVKITVKKKKK